MMVSTRMREVTTRQLEELLASLGIEAGQGLLVHSALQYLGKPENGIRSYFDALSKLLSLQPSVENPTAPQGTLAVPTFNFGFARGAVYDPLNTASEGMGGFSEFVRRQPTARRTQHPLQSLAAIGRYADRLAGCDTPSAFDPGSSFDLMLDLDFRLLLLGADVQAVSMVHHSEQRAGVPYRYWKEFTGQVQTDLGVQTRTYRMFVRDLDIDPQLNLRPVQALLENKGFWNTQRLNYGWVSYCRLVDFVAATDELLSADPWALVAKQGD